MAADCRVAGPQPGSSIARAAVGFYYSPPISTGLLYVHAAPVIAYAWYMFAMFGHTTNNAFVGFFVQEFDPEGQPTATVVDEQDSLWTYPTGLYDAGVRAPSVSAMFPVDAQHRYIIWLWCGVAASGDGQELELVAGGGGTVPPFYLWLTDEAIASVAVTVPYIGWTFMGS